MNAILHPKNKPMEWYQVQNENEIDSPALLIYLDRVQHNIDTMIEQVGGHASRLVPHVKTYKMGEIVQMQLAVGIHRFKCATIAELEMTLAAGAKWALVAYQLTGPKVSRFAQLQKSYPNATICSLIDNVASAQQLAQQLEKEGLVATVFLDVNNGQNRTGYVLDDTIFDTYCQLAAIPNLVLQGLHVYDGHLRDAEFSKRKAASDDAFAPVYDLIAQIEAAGLPTPEIISGGSPAFSSASQRPDVFCSPGTTLLWDWGYANLVPEVDFQWAAVLMTRVISKPNKGLITTDLGHKSVASENPLDRRIMFLNLSDYEPVGQSEEHLVLRVNDWESVQIGDVLYGIPYHVCPSVALHDVAHIIQHNKLIDTWDIVARKRKITF